MFAGDLLEHINVTRRIPMDEKELLKILSTLDAYHFVRLDLRKKAEFCRETILTIMPNIVCLLPYATVESIDEQLQAYTQETTKRKKPDEDQEDFGETGSNGRE
jgi:hypothetical protein